ncbi:MAG: NADP-dependent malic enzyme, partial [Alphaproteobacteria bacterium]|nr:NADP-dependent malic enzyme [Alphaproteobacteria bacterium]
IAPAVARAAMESGVATRPIADLAAYEGALERFVFRSGQLMQPVFAAAKHSATRIVYAEGEDERVLRAVQSALDDDIARPILVGRRAVIAEQVRAMGLRLPLGDRVQVIDPAEDTALMAPLLHAYRCLASRRGTPPDAAERRVRSHPTVAAALLLREGLADAAICGGKSEWWRDMEYVMPIIPKRPEVSRLYALTGLILQGGALFLCDTHMNVDPTAEQVAEMTVLAAEAMRAFGIVPKAALLSHSNFGASRSPSARKMRQALALLRARVPDLEVDGEMHADAALSEAIRNRTVAESRLSGTANLLVMPGLDAANIGYTLLKAAADALPVGPLLLGMSKPLHVVVPSVTARGILNVSAVAARQAQAMRSAATG